MPVTYRIGAWYHAGRFSDPRHDTAGLSLANPASNGIARQYRGDNAVYAVMDLVLWRPDGSVRGAAQGCRGLGHRLCQPG